MWKRPRIKLNNFKIVQAMTIDFFFPKFMRKYFKARQH